MPAQFGGLSNTIAASTFIDSGGIRIGSASIDLPTITTESGFEMSLTATLEQRDGGFELPPMAH
ncbi:MAG: hypothetical protein R2873_22570 [Caldilineaceae bacterium]